MPFLTYLPSIGHPVVEVPGIVTDGRWSHDLQAIDDAFAAGARTLVLCNPHNPTGTVLERTELEAIAAIVERHGGRVFAESAGEDKGSTFTLELPRVVSPALSDTPRARKASTGHGVEG